MLFLLPFQLPVTNYELLFTKPMGKIRTKVIDLAQEEGARSKKEERKSKKHRDKEAAVVDVVKEIPKPPETPKAPEAAEERETEKPLPPSPPTPPERSDASSLSRGKPPKLPKSPKAKHGRKHNDKVKLVDKTKEHSLDEAIKLVKESSYGKFDASVDVHINLGIDVTQPEQTVKFPFTFPHSVKKPPKVLIISNQDVPDKGEALIGGEETIKKIESGELKPGKDFEAVIAIPELMPKLAKIAKILGPKGMMPNPKTGTVSKEPGKVLQELSRGKTMVKNEANAPILHAKVGKCSLENSAIKENFLALYNELLKNKPAKIKGNFIKSIFLTSTMGPSVKLNLAEVGGKR